MNDTREKTYPMTLQFFADGAENAVVSSATSAATAQTEARGATGSAGVATAPAAGGGAQTPENAGGGRQREKPEDIAAAILAAVETATSRKEKTVVKSMAEQYGLSDEEAQEALNAAKAKKAAQLPPEVRAQMDALTRAANERLISAEVRSVGTDMGLVDAQMALLALDRKGVSVGEDGFVAGVKEALEALKESKSYLFKAASEAKPTGARVDVGAPTTPVNMPDYDSMSDAEFFRAKALEQRGKG